MMSAIRRYFISGLLVWLPIWVTLLVIRFVMNIMNQSLSLLPHRYQPDQLLGFHIPGVGVLITLVVIFLTGMIVANFIGRQLVALGDAFISRIPLVRSVYTGVKKTLETLFKPGSHSFRKVLLVEYPRKGLWSIAFQTGLGWQEVSQALQGEELVTFFIPTTPNPTSGFLMMMPKKDILELDVSVDQALKFVISLGVMQMQHPDTKHLEAEIKKI